MTTSTFRRPVEPAAYRRTFSETQLETKMFFHNTGSNRPPRKIDFMAGSERMLKAHHKNTVFHKSLEIKKNAYDWSCNKNISKLQQDIYDIYFNEYLPLKEQASNTRDGLPPIVYSKNSGNSKPLALPGRERKVFLPNIYYSSSSTLAGEEQMKQTEQFMDSLRDRETKTLTEIGDKRKIGSPKKQQQQSNSYGNKRDASRLQTACSLWYDSLSDTSDSPQIDERRLKILKTAIALTSQPAKTPEPRKPKRLRKSFLVSLRKQSKVVWENELISRAASGTSKTLKADKTCMEPVEETSEKSSLPEISRKWQPSLSKNRIFNDDDSDEDDDMEFHFADRSSRVSLGTVQDDTTRHSPRVSFRADIPLHDIEQDLYMPDSSPDMFSVISERTGSSYTYSSYTTGSDYDGSFYTTESDYDET